MTRGRASKASQSRAGLARGRSDITAAAQAAETSQGAALPAGVEGRDEPGGGPTDAPAGPSRADMLHRASYHLSRYGAEPVGASREPPAKRPRVKSTAPPAGPSRAGTLQLRSAFLKRHRVEPAGPPTAPPAGPTRAGTLRLHGAFLKRQSGS